MRRTTIACFATFATALTLPAGASAADAIYGVTDQNRLIRFNSDSPSRTLSNEPLRGLIEGERAVGIDVRPSDDHLYVVTSANRALQVNPVTGAVRPAFGPFNPALTGASYGVDFNPAANALRIVSDAEQNLRIGANNTTNNDAPLTYAPGDPGAGSNPSVGSAAYTNNVPGAESTVLFDLDTARDTLVRQDPPNQGRLNTVGPLGFDFTEPAGFDIAQGGTAYAALRPTGTNLHALYRIDLGTGRAAPAASVSGIGVPENAGTLVGISVAGGVDDDRTAPELSVAFSSTILEQNTDTLEPSVSCSEACSIRITADVQGRRAGTGTAALSQAGRVTVDVRLNQAARRRIARAGTELISLDIEATDAAGNRSRQDNRVSRTQTLSARRGG